MYLSINTIIYVQIFTVLVESDLFLHIEAVVSPHCYLHTPRSSQRKPFSITFCLKLSNNMFSLYSVNGALLRVSYLPTTNESRSHHVSPKLRKICKKIPETSTSKWHVPVSLT